ncbi:uncharacterized protein BDR25DRAFT_395763 [Lindgomyces ingoldianus]|uniref:Uncharacterized protein n=1 Tax=Lindgomyces ingoldianus TaxID=673940 RepID=A0ACB6QH55_9PLEO|nr:uncharacterized protein BDR25DRAFT_395763 [Lindgomyces ingoldianus]KAF2466211.1 hypothetical protein BDR25DRAFT_395763 [Lindgomyces ingoldianus]
MSYERSDAFYSEHLGYEEPTPKYGQAVEIGELRNCKHLCNELRELRNCKHIYRVLWDAKPKVDWAAYRGAPAPTYYIACSLVSLFPINSDGLVALSCKSNYTKQFLQPWPGWKKMSHGTAYVGLEHLLRTRLPRSNGIGPIKRESPIPVVRLFPLNIIATDINFLHAGTMPPNVPLPSPQDICLQVGNKTLYRQAVVPAPSSERFPTIATVAPTPQDPYGENILVIIPTANQFKKKAVQSRIEAQIGQDKSSRIIIHQQSVDSGVGNQPYDEKGLEGAYNRIRNTLAWLNHNQGILEEKKIGTVLVGVIENYIQRSTDGLSAVDYGVVVIYNATTGKVAGAISRGVTVPQTFLEEAEGQGFNDAGGKSGKVTVGEILEQNFGIDAANWHEVVCGTSRYALLEEALSTLHMFLKSLFRTNGFHISTTSTSNNYGIFIYEFHSE